MVREVDIIRVEVSTGKTEKKADFIAEETPLHLFVNNKFWATILSSPTDQKELAVGHLLSEGILKSIQEIQEIELKPKEKTCNVTIKPDIDLDLRVKLSRLHNRVIPSVCGSPAPYQYVGKVPRIDSELRVSAQVIFEGVNALNFKAAGFRLTGGLHVAAVYRADGTLVALAEDVGRHNAADKAIGMAALKETPLDECFFASSGRLSGDMTYKAAKVGIPIIASIAAALSSGLDAAEKTNVTLVGFVRGKRLNIYSAPQRIIV